METAAIILAAGAGTRMKSKKPKVVHEVLGRPLVRWVVEAAKGAGADRVVTVVGHMRDQVIPLVEGDTEVVVQEAQRGTADAVLAAADALAGFDGAVVVLSGDSPLIQPETIRQMAALREEHNAAVIVLTMELAPSATAALCATALARWPASSSKRTLCRRGGHHRVQLRRLLLRRPRPFRRPWPGELRQRPGRVLPHRRAGHQPRRRAARARL